MKTALQKTMLIATLSAICGWSNVANAQITITQADVPAIGTVMQNGKDTVTVVTPGGTGNQTWNFATLQPHKIDTSTLLDPAGQPGSNYFPGADIALANQTQGAISGYVYADVTPTEMSQMGVYGNFGFGMMPLVFEPPAKFAVFPSTYQTQFSGATKFIVQFALPYPPIDSVKSIVHLSYNNIIDAYGSLTTPSGTYNVLRQYNTEIKTDSTFLHDTTGTWTFDDTKTTPDSSYTFLANNVLSVLDIDSKGKAKYLISQGTGIESSLETDVFLFVYPNPSSDVLNFEGNLTQGATIEIFDINGNKMESLKTTNIKMSIDTKCYPAGLYLYRIVDAEHKPMAGKFNVVR